MVGEFQEENHPEPTVVFNFIPSLLISLHCLGTSPGHWPVPPLHLEKAQGPEKSMMQ